MRGAAVLALLLGAGIGQGQEAAPTVIVEVVVRDRRQAPIANLQPTEIELRQDAQAQAVVSMRPSGRPGGYLIRYVPRSGRPGPVMLRVLRPGAVATGPEGGALKVRIEEVLAPLDRRLLALLDAATPPADLAHEAFVLRFERDGDKVHHTFAVEVPLDRLELRAAEGLVKGNLGLLARVKNAQGEVVQRFSLEYPIEAEVALRDRLLGERLLWTSHLHLPAGRYVLETAVADLFSSAAGTGRLAFEAPAAVRGLRVSSLSVLAAGGALATEETAADNPLRHDERQLVPTPRRQLVSGGQEQLAFYVIVFPDPSLAEPAQAALELYRSGALVGRGSIALPASTGAIPYRGSFPVANLQPGTYEMKVVARQGAALAAEAAAFEMVPPPRFKEEPAPPPARGAEGRSTGGRPTRPATARPEPPAPCRRGA
jgi:hypothetical protein